MRVFALCSLLCVAGCASVDDPEREVLEILVYSPGDPRPLGGGFVTQAKRSVVTVGEDEFSLMAWAVGDTLYLGAMAKSEGFFNARFEMPEAVVFPVGADAHGEVAALGESTKTAEGAGFRGFHWVTFDMPRSALAEGSSLALWFASREEGELVGESEPPHGSPTAALPPLGSEGRRQFFEVRYSEAPAPSGDS